MAEIKVSKSVALLIFSSSHSQQLFAHLSALHQEIRRGNGVVTAPGDDDNSGRRQGDWDKILFFASF